MKKVKSSVALFLRTHLFAQGASKNKKVSSDKVGDSSNQLSQSVETEVPPSLKATRKFKVALISSYTFLISLFGAIVYIALAGPIFSGLISDNKTITNT